MTRSQILALLSDGEPHALSLCYRHTRILTDLALRGQVRAVWPVRVDGRATVQAALASSPWRWSHEARAWVRHVDPEAGEVAR